ncbi:MAG TPA: hypothetical protein VFX30_11365 [bacterium]|nr:hypothetical protein [bacterium]
MACGPIPLTPQMLSTAMALMGQPAGLPTGLSVLEKNGQMDLQVEVLCEADQPVGFAVSRYLDTKTPITRVVPLDDGEVDEQTSYVQSNADGYLTQTLTVRLDSEYKLAAYDMQTVCGGNNPNALVCTRHLPTVQALAVPDSSGKHPAWMKTFVPDVEAGGEYVFVAMEDYPQAKKDIDEKRKAASVPSAPPSAEPTPVPTVVPSSAPKAAPAPSIAAPAASENPRPAREKETSSDTSDRNGFAWYHVLGLIVGTLGLRELFERLRKPKT